MKDAAMEKLIRSLRDFGLPQPLIVNRTSGQIVGGHQRWEAAKRLGWETVPVVWMELSEDEEKALNVALNNLELQGEWDLKQLAKVLQSITDKAVLDATGFDQQKIDALIENYLREVDEAQAPVYPITPRFLEHYAYAVIVTQHETDWANLKEMLDLRDEHSYKNDKVILGRVVEFDRFRERFEAARRLSYGDSADKPHVYQRAHYVESAGGFICGVCGLREPAEVHVSPPDVVTFLDRLIELPTSDESMSVEQIAQMAAELRNRAQR